MKMHILLVALVLMAISVGGCTTTSDRHHTLQSTLIVYEKAMRWGHLDTLAGFRKPGNELTPAEQEQYENIRIGGYNVVAFTMAPGGKQAKQIVEVDYVDEDTMRVIKIVDKQVWEYDDEANRWFISSSLPTLR